MIKPLITLVAIVCLTGCAHRSHEVVGEWTTPRVPEVHWVDSPNVGEPVPVWLDGAIGETDEPAHLLVLLDGSEYDGIARDIETLFRFQGKCPPLVIAALPTDSPRRWRDYTKTNQAPPEGADADLVALYESSGGFPKFARFVEDELLPMLGERHGEPFASRSLFGHSNGGLAAMAFLLDASHVFQRSSSPVRRRSSTTSRSSDSSKPRNRSAPTGSS